MTIPAANELLIITRTFLQSLKQSNKLDEKTARTIDVYSHFLERFPFDLEILSTFSRECYSEEFVDSFIKKYSLESIIFIDSHPLAKEETNELVADTDPQIIIAEPEILIPNPQPQSDSSLSDQFLSMQNLEESIDRPRKSDSFLDTIPLPNPVLTPSITTMINEKIQNQIELPISSEINHFLQKSFAKEEPPKVDVAGKELLTTAFLKELAAKQYQPPNIIESLLPPPLPTITTSMPLQVFKAQHDYSMNHTIPSTISQPPFAFQYSMNQQQFQNDISTSLQSTPSYMLENELNKTSISSKQIKNEQIPPFNFPSLSQQPIISTTTINFQLASKYGISQVNPNNYNHEMTYPQTLLKRQLVTDIPSSIEPKFNPKNLLEEVRSQIATMKHHNRMFSKQTNEQRDEKGNRTTASRMDLHIPNLSREKGVPGNIIFDLFHQMKQSLKNIVVYAHKDQRKASMFRIENDLQMQKKQIKDSFAQYQITVLRQNLNQGNTNTKQSGIQSAYNSPSNHKYKLKKEQQNKYENNSQTLSSKYMLERFKLQSETQINPPYPPSSNARNLSEINDLTFKQNPVTNPFILSEKIESNSYKQNDFSSFVNQAPPLPPQNIILGAVSPSISYQDISNSNTNNYKLHQNSNHLLSDRKNPSVREYIPFYQNSAYQLNNGATSTNQQNNQKHHFSRHLYIEDQKIY